MQAILLYALALGAGVSVAVQQVLNGALRATLGSPAWAGFVSYLVGLLTMIVVLFALGERLPSWKAVADTPWWAWSGGVLGGVFILLMILLLPSLGAATLIALVVAGQMAIAIALDHFGAFGLAIASGQHFAPRRRGAADRRRGPDQGLIQGSSPDSRSAGAASGEARNFRSRSDGATLSDAARRPAENTAGLCSSRGIGPTISTPPTSFNSLICCTARSASPDTSNSAVTPAE